MFWNCLPRVLVPELPSTTVTLTTTCCPAGMSMPLAVSWITRFVALPVLTGVKAGPETRSTLTKRRSTPVTEGLRSSRMRTSYIAVACGTAGTVML